MINLILLAAGCSSRFGENKLLYPIDGQPMFAHMLNCALEFREKSPGAVRVILVTAGEAVKALASDRGFTDASGGDRVVLSNRHQERGISYSIKLGIEAAGPLTGQDSLMFAVCDQPYLRSGELLRFAADFHASGRGIGCMSHAGVPGNPVIFNSRYREELLSLTGDTGGRKVVRNHGDDVFLFEVGDATSLKDIDRREEAEQGR